MKQVTAYQTSDGEMFTSEADAAMHEADISLRRIVNRFRFERQSPSEDEKAAMVENIRQHGFYINEVLVEMLKHVTLPAEEDDS